jgi:hypothetical protein
VLCRGCAGFVGLVQVALWHGVLQLDENNAQANGNKRPLSESVVLEPVLGTSPCSPDPFVDLWITIVVPVLIDSSRLS